MFVYTVTKKRAVRTLLLALAVLAGIVIGIAAILNSLNTKAEERKVPIYQVDRADNKIALTFNCAWGNSNTDELLGILKKENIKATFFVTGEFCDKYPEDVSKMFQAGHEIQSHSDKHPHVEGANINDFIADTRQVETKITAITGVKPTLYRAPYGEYDNNSIFTINGMGYKYIQWSVDSIDWQEPAPAKIVKRVVSKAESGAIVLFHNDLANTTKALPEVISKLKDKGFGFSTVSDLIYWDNYTISGSGKQSLSKNADINAQVHIPGTQINAAFEALLDNLTLEEIQSLENGISPSVTAKLAKVLTKEQIEAVSALSEDELRSAWGMLVEAKVTGNMGFLAVPNDNTDATTAASAGSATTAGSAGVTAAPDTVKGGVNNTVTSTTPKDVKGGNVMGDAVTGVTAAPASTAAPVGTTAAPVVTTAPDTTMPVVDPKY